jgi:hypothetical protein
MLAGASLRMEVTGRSLMADILEAVPPCGRQDLACPAEEGTQNACGWLRRYMITHPRRTEMSTTAVNSQGG